MGGFSLKELKIIATTLTAGVFVLAAFFVFFSLKQDSSVKLPGERDGGVCTDIPQFSEYPAKIPASIASTSVDFESYPEAKDFKIAIEQWFAQGTQLGGYYTVAEWGCGAGCQNHAIIDRKNGKITAFRLVSSDGVMYSPDSNLLIINPSWNLVNDLGRTATASAEFYELRGGVPRLICTKTYPPNKH
jgi:hypothetical protein